MFPKSSCVASDIQRTIESCIDCASYNQSCLVVMVMSQLRAIMLLYIHYSQGQQNLAFTASSISLIVEYGYCLQTGLLASNLGPLSLSLCSSKNEKRGKTENKRRKAGGNGGPGHNWVISLSRL